MLSTTELLSGRYRLGPLLGQGGMSDVYRATDEHSGEAVAIKVVRSADPDLTRRLAREVQVHQQLDHPGLIRLIGTGTAGEQTYLVMELVEGATLATFIRQAPLGPRRTARAGRLVAGALHYMHAQGMVHRDVKPSNIMLAEDGRALLGDFGIARLVDSATLTLDGTTIGTAAYMAPEQLEQHEVGPSADIWSLGMVLLECLTGRRIYEGTWSDIIARRLVGPVPLPADLPVPWMLLLTGMLDHRPAHRLSADEVGALLESPAFERPWAPSGIADTDRMVTAAPYDLTALTAIPTAPVGTAVDDPLTRTAAAPTRIGPPPPPRSRRRLVIVAALTAAVLAVLGGALAYGLGNSPGSPPTNRSGTHSHSSTTTTVPPTTTTSTTVTAGAGALATLVRDLTSGLQTGLIDRGVVQSITTQAQQAVADADAGQIAQATNQMDHIGTTLENAVQNGDINGPLYQSLYNDVAALATALGIGTGGSLLPSTVATPPGGPAANNAGPGAHGHGSKAGGQ